MRPYLERLPSDPESSLICLRRRMPKGIPFQWHNHPEFELTMTLKSRGQQFIGDYVGDYEDGDFVHGESGTKTRVVLGDRDMQHAGEWGVRRKFVQGGGRSGCYARSLMSSAVDDFLYPLLVGVRLRRGS